MGYFGVDINHVRYEAFETNADGDLIPSDNFMIDDPYFELDDNFEDLRLKNSLYFKLPKEVESISNTDLEDLIVYG
jgi:hypothetical protein|tara:strand:+ start:1060 stop:1287 length:228 start_codon:yes stop_codon:yes gene_type:complete